MDSDEKWDETKNITETLQLARLTIQEPNKQTPWHIQLFASLPFHLHVLPRRYVIYLVNKTSCPN